MDTKKDLIEEIYEDIEEQLDTLIFTANSKPSVPNGFPMQNHIDWDKWESSCEQYDKNIKKIKDRILKAFRVCT